MPAPRSARSMAIIFRVTRRRGCLGCAVFGAETADHNVPANAAITIPERLRLALLSLQVHLHGADITAKFVVNVRGYTTDDDDMVCLDLVVDFVSCAGTCVGR